MLKSPEQKRLDARAEELLLSYGMLQEHRAFFEDPECPDVGECGCELVAGGTGMCLAGSWEEGMIESVDVIEELESALPVPDVRSTK